MRELWEHQKQAIQNAGMLQNYALFFEQGTGKTRTCLEIMRGKFNNQGRLLRSLILTLPLPVPQWRGEWLEFTKIPPKNVVLLQGPGKKRLKSFLEQIAKDPNTVFITNHESLLMRDLFVALKDWRPEVVVFDESHKFKSHTAKRSKLAWEIANPRDMATKRSISKPHTYLLSGTPVLNSPMDLFQQFKILDGGYTFGGNYFAFRGRYFRDRNVGMPSDRYFPNWEVMTIEKDGIDGMTEIQNAIAAQSMRVLKKDCMDLPPDVFVRVPVAMNRDQQRLYDEMKQDLITYYKSKACVASLALTKAIRLMQIASGFVAAHTVGAEDEKTEIDLGVTPKLDALKELLSEIVENGGKVLVWAVFKHNYKQIAQVCEDLKIKYVEVHGGISEKQKLANVKSFQTDPDTKVFIGHPLSGGIGLNLVVAGYSIFYSRNFSLEQYLQALARNNRGGSKEAGHEKITHYNLVCENTIEELALRRLASKEELSERLLGSLIDELEKSA